MRLLKANFIEPDKALFLPKKYLIILYPPPPPTPGIRSMQWGYIVFVFSVCLSVSQSVSLSVCLSVNIYFVSKISQELLYLET